MSKGGKQGIRDTGLAEKQEAIETSRNEGKNSDNRRKNKFITRI